MQISNVMAVSPIDGRYHNKTNALAPYFSEYALIYYRFIVEVRYLQALLKTPHIQKNIQSPIPNDEVLNALIKSFDESSALAIKTIEKTTNHDVKAVEYFLRDKLIERDFNQEITNLIHFGLTSEDINNLAYALMLKAGIDDVIEIAIDKCLSQLKSITKNHEKTPMLSRTHGQSATPTTLGKEMANFYNRLNESKNQLKAIQIKGKLNGAVGNFNAHHIACPEINWPLFSKNFIEGLGLSYNAYTNQIEPHDFIANINHAMIRINTILLDFSRDIWHYISLDYFKLKAKANEVGSSTMPHKVNPIDFENAEGNLGIANALFEHLATKLPVSRLQRDLSDSTALRNIGVCFAHSLIAYQSLHKGIDKLDVNEKVLLDDLENHPEVLAEAIQTVMRLANIDSPYEKLKAHTRGKKIDKATLDSFIDTLTIDSQKKQMLKNLSPQSYLGYATKLCQAIL